MNHNTTPTTLQDVLNLVVDPNDPLKVGTGVANYRAALKCVTRLKGMPSDLALIPADAERILTAINRARAKRRLHSGCHGHAGSPQP